MSICGRKCAFGTLQSEKQLWGRTSRKEQFEARTEGSKQEPPQHCGTLAAAQDYPAEALCSHHLPPTVHVLRGKKQKRAGSHHYPYLSLTGFRLPMFSDKNLHISCPGLRQPAWQQLLMFILFGAWAPGFHWWDHVPYKWQRLGPAGGPTRVANDWKFILDFYSDFNIPCPSCLNILSHQSSEVFRKSMKLKSYKCPKLSIIWLMYGIY